MQVDLNHIHLFQQVRSNIVKCCKDILSVKVINQKNLEYMSKNFDQMLYLISVYTGAEEVENKYTKDVYQEFYNQMVAIFSTDFMPHEKQFLLDTLVKYDNNKNFIGVAKFMQLDSALKYFVADVLLAPETDKKIEKFNNSLADLDFDSKSLSFDIKNHLQKKAKPIENYASLGKFFQNSYVFGDDLLIKIPQNRYVQGYRLKREDVYILQNLGFNSLNVNIVKLNSEVSQLSLTIKDAGLIGSFLAEDLELPNSNKFFELRLRKNAFVTLSTLRQLDSYNVKSLLVSYNNEIGFLSWTDLAAFQFVSDNNSQMILASDPDLSNASIRLGEDVSFGEMHGLRFKKGFAVRPKEYWLLQKLKQPVLLINKNDKYAMTLSQNNEFNKIHEWLMLEVGKWRVENARLWADVENVPNNIVIANLNLEWQAKKQDDCLNKLKQWGYFYRLFSEHSIVRDIIREVDFAQHMQQHQPGVNSKDFLSTFYQTNARIAAANLFGRALRQSIGANALRHANHSGVNSVVYAYSLKECKARYQSEAYSLGYRMTFAKTPVVSVADARAFSQAMSIANTVYHPRHGASGDFSRLSPDLIEHVLGFVAPVNLQQAMLSNLDRDNNCFIVTQRAGFLAPRQTLMLADASLEQYEARVDSNMLSNRYASQMQARADLEGFENSSLPSSVKGNKFLNVMMAVWPTYGKVIEDILFVLIMTVLLIFLTEVPLLVALLSVIPVCLLLGCALADIYEKNKHLVASSIVERAYQTAVASNEIAPIVQADNLTRVLSSELDSGAEFEPSYVAATDIRAGGMYQSPVSVC